jgi:succinoglycan biosynthesis protein ExoM
MFERQRLSTGTRVPHGATNNVMVRTSALGRPPATFDDAFGLTGGEDIEFFARLSRRGATLVWCDEAEVHEPIPHSRLSKSWVLRRSFRSGQTVYRIFVANWPWTRKAPWLLYKAIQASMGWLLGVALRLSGRDSSMKWLGAAYRALGQLSGITGGSIVREYDAPPK